MFPVGTAHMCGEADVGRRRCVTLRCGHPLSMVVQMRTHSIGQVTQRVGVAGGEREHLLLPSARRIVLRVSQWGFFNHDVRVRATEAE